MYITIIFLKYPSVPCNQVIEVISIIAPLTYVPEDPCGINQPLIIENATQGYIKSPNYPNGYPHGVSCSWKIKINYGIRMSIILTDIAIEHA